MPKLIDLTGQKFNRLTVIRKVEDGRTNNIKWMCKCECGNETTVFGANLREGLTRSCGCLHREEKEKHMLSKSPIYAVWNNMKERCYNQDANHYSVYGGRGITICDEWKGDFKDFYDWCVNNGWEKGLQIDRIDCDGNYEPSNCRFVTPQQNCYNTRPHKGSSSKYKGVFGGRGNGKWRAAIGHNGKFIHLGHFIDEIEAALIYDSKAEELQKEYAWLNRDHFEEVMDRYKEQQDE